MVEPLRDIPRPELPSPKALPPLPPRVPAHPEYFQLPESLPALISALQSPLLKNPDLPALTIPARASSAHSFRGGSGAAHDRLQHLIDSGAASSYKDTRNSLLDEDGSTKLSAYLALGCITARQIHHALVAFEDDPSPSSDEHGRGKGENKGTAAIRFELLWRDFMRLSLRKFGSAFFSQHGFTRLNDYGHGWTDTDTAQGHDVLMRLLKGTTGAGLVDASARELLCTGYTSNRARQNFASFLAKSSGSSPLLKTPNNSEAPLDWRVGAEWYESMLVDYDVASNWGNWAYVAGVGADARENRMFNPVKQAHDYDEGAKYVRAWVEEAAKLEQDRWCWANWEVPEGKGMDGYIGKEKPLVKVQWSGKDRGGKGGRGTHRGRGMRGGRTHRT